MLGDPLSGITAAYSGGSPSLGSCKNLEGPSVPLESGPLVLQPINLAADTLITQHMGSSKETAGCSIISSDKCGLQNLPKLWGQVL